MAEDANPFSRAIIETAKLFKIPSVVFIHGPPSSKIGFIPSISSYIFVFGKKTRDFFVKNGTDERKVVSIGCPRYDTFFVSKKKQFEKKIVYLMEIANKDALIPSTHLTKKKQKKALRDIFRILKKFPGYKLILKIRKGWDMAGLPQIVAEEEKFSNFDVIEKADNIRLINEADIVLINYTTMGLESLLLDKPTICFSFKDLEQVNPYKDTPAIEKVFDADSLEKAIRKNLNQTPENSLKRKESLKKHFDILDKKASERAVKFIGSILQNKKQESARKWLLEKDFS
jgi:UDP-N-acetylglucosamine 2-epimerase